MTRVIENEQTGECDIVDDITGEVLDSCDDKLAARYLARLYNEEA